MCRPSGFENYVEMTRVTPRSISNSGTWILHILRRILHILRRILHIGSYIFYEELIVWTLVPRIHIIPYVIPFVLRYVTCPRFDRQYPDTLFNLVTGKSLYSFRNTSSHDQPLGHIVHIMMMSYRVGPEIPLRLHGVTNPSLDSCQPNRHFRRYL